MKIFLEHDPDTIQNVKDAEALAKLLNGKVESVYCYNFTIKLDKGGVYVDTRQHRGHWAVSGVWPWNSEENQQFIPKADDRPYIKVSKSRGVEGLFKDIKKRFLDIYLPMYDEQVKASQQASEDRNTQVALIGAFAALAECSVTPETLRSGVLHAYKHNIHTVTVHSHGTVEIKTYPLHPDLARKVLKVLIEGTKKYGDG